MVVKFTLNNGTRCIINDIKCFNTLCIIILFGVGSRHEPPGFHGIAHFIEHMLFKGTTKYNSTEISQLITKNGGKINAFTSNEHTGYYIIIDKNKLEIACELLSDMIYNPCLTAIETEKTIIIAENKMRDSSPSHRAMEETMKSVFTGSGLEHSIGGSTTQIKNFNLKKILTFMQQYYCNQNMIISISGNVPNKCRSIISKYFSNKLHFNMNLPQLKYKLKLQHNPRIKRIKMPTEHSFIYMSFPTYGIRDKRISIVDCIGTIFAGNMNSRLFLQLREKCGLVYSVRYSTNFFYNEGLFTIYCSTAHSNVAKCIKIIKSVITNTINNNIDTDELNDAKNYMIGDINQIIEDTKKTALYYACQLINTGKIQNINREINIINKINIKDINIVMKELFNWNHMSLIIICP